MKTHPIRAAVRATAAAVAAGSLLLWGATTAFAHVSVSASDTAAGAYTILTFSVPHGCDGSATTEVSIQMPEQINAATPTRTANWEVEKVMQTLDAPITDSHGNEITERVGEVVYTATTPLPDGYRDAFEISVQLPETPGETLVFPVVQTCEQGETAWIEIPEEGQSEDELEAPAPSIEVTEAIDGDGHAEDNAATESEGSEAAESSESTTGDADDGETSPVTWVALGVGVVGLVTGGVALARTRRTE
jgi:uncharacterized protein YcnI